MPKKKKIFIALLGAILLFTIIFTCSNIPITFISPILKNAEDITSLHVEIDRFPNNDSSLYTIRDPDTITMAQIIDQLASMKLQFLRFSNGFTYSDDDTPLIILTLNQGDRIALTANGDLFLNSVHYNTKNESGAILFQNILDIMSGRLDDTKWEFIPL